jgi:capsular exopolysaccharide synthesis family protein
LGCCSLKISVTLLEQATSPASASATRESPSLFSVLRRRASTILIITLLAGGAAAALALANRDSYESTAKLLFRQTVGPGLTGIGFPVGAPDADNLAANNIELVDSRRVAGVTARELGDRGIDMSADDVEADVLVDGSKDSDVVNVTAKADSAERAQLIARTYAQSAVTLAEADDRAQAARVLANLDKQWADLSKRERKGADGRRLEGNRERLRALIAAGTGSPQIIQPAYLPTEESSNLLQTILLGLLFGLVLGVALALLRDQADRRLHRAEDVSGAFEAPVVTTVPRHRKLQKHARYGDLPPEVAEAFRMLQVNLRYGRDHPVRTVLVTSSRSREGKTTVAWNLASAAASSGLSVVLVEADMRRPALAKRYGLDPGPGLAEVLRGDIATSAALQPVFPSPNDAAGNGRPTGRLQVIVAGNAPHDPWALTQSPAMERLLEVLTEHHDLVVFDTPPIPHVADAVSLLGRVDGVIVTASLNNTRGPDAERLRNQLASLDAPVLGVVANGGSAVDGYAYAPAGSPRFAGNGASAPER